MRLAVLFLFIIFTQIAWAAEVPVILNNYTPFNITVSLPANISHTPILLTQKITIAAFDKEVVANVLPNESARYDFSIIITVGNGDKLFKRNMDIMNFASDVRDLYALNYLNTTLHYKDEENEINSLRIDHGFVQGNFPCFYINIS